jgi:hypothetical protein
MTDSARRFCGPVPLTAVSETVIEVPSGVQWIIRNIHVANADASVEALFSMGHSFDDADHAIFRTVVPPYGVLDWSGFMVLNDGESILASAQTGAVTLVVSGVEVTV